MTHVCDASHGHTQIAVLELMNGAMHMGHSTMSVRVGRPGAGRCLPYRSVLSRY